MATRGSAVCRVVGVAAGVAIAAFTAGCDAPSAHGPAQMPPPSVSVVTMQPRTISATFEYVGQTTGVREVEVRARVSGILLKWNYDEGKPVRAGQSLFTIDPAPFQAALARAEAELAGARARLEAARLDVERTRPLTEQGMLSRKALDDALAAQQVAAAGVQVAEAVVTEARLNLGYTRVEAPIGGITSRALMSEGSLVEAQNTLLTTISQIEPIHVIFSVSESDRLRLSSEAAAGRLVLPKDNRFKVTVTLADGSVAERPGTLDFADVRVNPETGTSELRAVLSNPDGRLRPGQFVRVNVQGARYPNALAVPQRAVLEGPQGKLVMVVNDKSIAEPRPVQVGPWAGSDWIISSGLAAGDRVIVDGVMRIQPGAPVTVAQAPAPEPQPPTAKP
jgi:membrane fusion protein (multidrug efflux system)